MTDSVDSYQGKKHSGIITQAQTQTHICIFAISTVAHSAALWPHSKWVPGSNHSSRRPGFSCRQNMLG